MENMYTGIYYTALHGIQKLALQKQYSLKIIPLSSEQGQKISSLQEVCGKSHGVILLHEYDKELDCPKIDLPAVGILMHNNFKGKISNIDIDPFNAAESAVEYFRNRDRKKVVVITSYHETCGLHTTYTNRGKIFTEYWRDEGFEVSDFIACPPSSITPIKFLWIAGIYSLQTACFRHTQSIFLTKLAWN